MHPATVVGAVSALLLVGCSLDRSGLSSPGGHDGGVADAASADGGTADGAVPDDGGPPLPCEPSSCDDLVACTSDGCGPTGCEYVPDDSTCTAAAGGSCDATLGCQYPTCTPATCTPDDACSTATCEGDTCVRASSCTIGESCCAGSCVPAGCDDGNACTDDACGATGCEHSDNTASCDDGAFCNGADVCDAGVCASDGDPCVGATTLCDEAMDACVECLVDGDCTVPAPGPWSMCSGFADACAGDGTQTRTVSTASCVAGACMIGTMMEMQACTRMTDGDPCGSVSCTDFGACVYSSTCDETGRRVRTCTTPTCMDEACTMVMSTDSRACSRNTDFNSCRADGNSCTSDYCRNGRCIHPCRSNCRCFSSGGCVCSF